jgi:hypothetical protein
MVQEKGRSEILLDYHLRVGQPTRDTQIPPGQIIREQRLDETEIGEGTTMTFVDARRPGTLNKEALPVEIAVYLGLDANTKSLVGWDVYDAVLTPGELILMMVWMMKADADAFGTSAAVPEGGRLRHVRVVRDYGMFDRREAPQYYPAVEPRQRNG